MVYIAMLLLFLLFVLLSPGVVFTLPVGKGNTLLTVVAHSVLFIIIYSILRSTHIEGFKTEVTDSAPNGGYKAQKDTIISITHAITTVQAAVVAAQNTLDTTTKHAEEAIASAKATLDAAQKEFLNAQSVLVIAQATLADYCCPTCSPPVPC